MSRNRYGRIIIAAIVILATLTGCCLCRWGCQRVFTPALSTSRQKPSTASVSGTVAETPGGRPVAGATVTVGHYRLTTDTNGRFQTPLMSSRLMRIVVSGRTVRPASRHLALRAGLNEINISVESIFHVRPGQTAAPVTPQVIRHGNRNVPMVAFTFDDGWNMDYRVIEVMTQNGLRGTAFLIGGRGVVSEHPELVKALRDADFEVCAHGYGHKTNTDLNDAQLNEEIQRGQKVITDLDGMRWPYFRPSGGTYDDRTVNVIGANGFNTVLWSIDSLDTRAKMTTAERVEQILANVGNGDIIIFHFGGYGTADLVAALIPALRERGLRIGTVTDVLQP